MTPDCSGAAVLKGLSGGGHETGALGLAAGGCQGPSCWHSCPGATRIASGSGSLGESDTQAVRGPLVGFRG